jgi:hypothetical protein
VTENDNDKPDAETPEKPTVSLDEHRGMTAQKETDARRQQDGVRADQEALRQGQAALAQYLTSGPAATWNEAGQKAAYLLRLFAATGDAQDPRYKRLIEETIEDLHRLGRAPDQT